jgi:NhaP-type Na+/H+ or K+/H+ antiporter
MLGIIIGPFCLNWFAPRLAFQDLHVVILEFSRVCLCIQVMAAGIQIPGNYWKREAKSLSIVLTVLMMAMWVVSAIGIKYIFELNWQYAFTIAACMTPTDPVLANSIIKGVFADTHISMNVREILSAESGSNDGLGLPFLLIPLYLSRYENVGEGFGLMLVKVIGYQVMFSIVYGIFVGYIARRLLELSHERNWIDNESLLGFSVALALFISGTMTLLGSDDILACYVAGTTLSWDGWLNDRIEETHIQEVLDALLNSTYFLFFGTIIPWNLYGSVGLEWWKLFALAGWIIVLRRIPASMLLSPWIPALRNGREAFFFGWFGPMGVSALYYSSLSIYSLGLKEKTVFGIVSFIVLTSVVIHGGSVSLFHVGLNSEKRISLNGDNSQSALPLSRLMTV